VYREPDPETEPISVRVFEETAAGKSAQQIADGRNSDGIPAAGGGAWTSPALRGNRTRGGRILRNETYIGRVH
jgi:site-specific DNA recombinase